MLKMILATGIDNSLGKSGKLLWHCPEDLQYFKKQTDYCPVVMGRKTFEGLPFKYGLPNRPNYILSSKGKGPQEGGYVIIQDINCLKYMGQERDVWVCGGASVYEQFKDIVQEIHWTTVNETFEDADCHFDMSWILDKELFEQTSEEVLCDLATVRIYKRK